MKCLSRKTIGKLNFIINKITGYFKQNFYILLYLWIVSSILGRNAQQNFHQRLFISLPQDDTEILSHGWHKRMNDFHPSLQKKILLN